MHSRVTWEISLSPDTHTASNSLHPDNKTLRRLSQYFLSSLDPKRNLGSRPLTQRDSRLWVDRTLTLLTLDASSVCTVPMFQKRDGSFYLWLILKSKFPRGPYISCSDFEICCLHRRLRISESYLLGRRMPETSPRKNLGGCDRRKACHSPEKNHLQGCLTQAFHKPWVWYCCDLHRPLLVLCCILQIWQKDHPLRNHGCADWLQLSADFFHQLGDVHRVICHRRHGPDLQLRGGLHTR